MLEDVWNVLSKNAKFNVSINALSNIMFEMNWRIAKIKNAISIVTTL